jgi:hypothetical protein
MVWRFLDGANFVQNAVKLNALLVPLFLTLSPSRAQNQTEIPTPFHDLLSVQTRNFSSRAAFSPTSPSITSNLVTNAAPLFSTLALPDHPPSALSADIARKRILPLPTTSCFSPNQGDLLSGCAIFSPATFTISAANFSPYPSESILHAPDHTEKFHWKTAIWQSFGFLVVGHASPMIPALAIFSYTSRSGMTIGLPLTISICPAGEMVTVSSSTTSTIPWKAPSLATFS